MVAQCGETERMATVKEMIAEYNALVSILGGNELTAWKQAGSKLEERLAAMRAEVDRRRTETPAHPEGTVHPVTAEQVEELLRAEAEAEAAEAADDPLSLTDEQVEDLADAEQAIADRDQAIADMEEAAASEQSPPKPKRAKKDKAPRVVDERGTIGQMVRELLLDDEGYGYVEIVEIVKGEFPEANTSRRSVASVAAELRRKGVAVPMRRREKGATE